MRIGQVFGVLTISFTLLYSSHSIAEQLAQKPATTTSIAASGQPHQEPVQRHEGASSVSGKPSAALACESVSRVPPAVSGVSACGASAPGAGDVKGKEDPNEVIARWTIWIAAATAAGVMVAALQLILLVRGSSDTKNAALASASAAETAKIALKKLERPYVMVNVPTAGIHVVAEKEVAAGQAVLKIFNPGRSPALLQSLIYQAQVLSAGQEPTPLMENDPRTKLLPYGTFCGANGDPFSEDFRVDPMDYGVSVAIKKMDVWVHGLVTYGDFIGGRYQTGFAFKFNVKLNRFEHAGSAAVNFAKVVSEGV